MLPVITLSRQFASDGHPIAQKVAEALDVPFYDKALIALAAKESGFSEEIFAQVDEKATSSLLYSMVMGSYAFGSRMAGVNEMPINDKLFIIQSDIIKKAAAEGSCVVVGRCADYVLRDHPNVLRIFIRANKDFRIRRAIDEHFAEPRKAADHISKQDKQRANYYNFYTNRKWDDMSNYDLVVDSSTFSLDSAVDLIVSAARSLDK